MDNKFKLPKAYPYFQSNKKLLDKLNKRAYGGLTRREYEWAYVIVENDASVLSLLIEFNEAAPPLVSKAAAVYEDLHVYCKKTRDELKALYIVSKDSNTSIAARCVAALSYKHLSGETP